MDRNKTNTTKIGIKKSIACMGHSGSFSHSVAKALHPIWWIESHTNVENVGKAVDCGDCTLGILPIENSIAGTIQETFDTLLRHNLTIVGERFLPVEHHLLVPKNGATQLQSIKRILSHPKAFEQCRIFLESLPHADWIMVHDTAEAARRVAVNPDPLSAAIASSEAARIHGLQILVKNIHSNPNNCTRFIIVQKKPQRVCGTKATICATLPHVPGSLHRLLESFSDHALNLTHIESRPIVGKAWEYTFLIDLEIGNNSPRFASALRQARRIASKVSIIGIYEKGIQI